MLFYLTCEADLDFPIPNANRVVAELRALSDGAKPVATKVVAAALGCNVSAIEDVLRRALHNGLVRQIGDDGWVPNAMETRSQW
jgi:hypothetical protein